MNNLCIGRNAGLTMMGSRNICIGNNTDVPDPYIDDYVNLFNVVRVRSPWLSAAIRAGAVPMIRLYARVRYH